MSLYLKRSDYAVRKLLRRASREQDLEAAWMALDSGIIHESVTHLSALERISNKQCQHLQYQIDLLRRSGRSTLTNDIKTARLAWVTLHSECLDAIDQALKNTPLFNQSSKSGKGHGT